MGAELRSEEGKGAGFQLGIAEMQSFLLPVFALE